MPSFLAFFLMFGSVGLRLPCVLLPAQTARDDEGQWPVGPALLTGEDAPLLGAREQEGQSN